MQRVLAFLRRDRGALARHLAVCAAALLAYLFAEELRVSDIVLWLLGSAALANFVSYLATTSRRAGVARLGRVVSPMLGVASWGALIGITGGVEHSPFIAGLWLEIALSALSAPLIGTAAVAALALVALWTQELFVGSTPLLLTVHTSFLGLETAVILLLNKTWIASRKALSASVVEKSRKVSELEECLEDAHMLTRTGEETARLGHGLKNAVHSLRGFTQLMEQVHGETKVEPDVLDGLQRAIDQLEMLAQRTLACNGGPEWITGEEACSLVQETVNEAAGAFPGVSCHVRLTPPAGDLCISPSELRDVTTNLVLNAIEAMEGHGALSLESNDSDPWQLQVTDQGPGLTEEIRRRLFRVGKTTKTTGSGFGLYLCRQLIESHGGRLLASSPAKGGACFSVSLPVLERPR